MIVKNGPKVKLICDYFLEILNSLTLIWKYARIFHKIYFCKIDFSYLVITLKLRDKKLE